MSQNGDGFYDIFVSYASADNDLAPPYDRWVSRFVDALRRSLRQKMRGNEPRIYFDESSIEANHQLEEILKACRNSTLFLAISSPAYHERRWTRKEIETFVAENPDPRRIFLAEVERPDEQSLVAALTERHASRFYRADSGTSGMVPLPLKPGDDDFYQRIVDLAASISHQLAAMSSADAGAQPQAQIGHDPKLGPVLLAQTTDDLEDERDGLRRYLAQFGVEVLPGGDYPQGGDAFRAAFQTDLKRSKLVVQLLGARAGRTPPDMEIGYTRYQAETVQEAKVKLMQWRRLDIEVDQIADGPHKALLMGADVTASTLEQFKSEVLKRLQPKVATPEPKDFLVFVNAEKEDRVAGQKVRDALDGACWVYMPQEAGAGSIQTEFNEALGECDALVLMYGRAESDWIVRQMLHLRKARAGKAPLPKVLCYGPPPGKSEINLSVPGFREVNCQSADGTDWLMEPIITLLSEFRS